MISKLKWMNMYRTGIKYNKVIFVINSVQNQRCIKRINEFLTHGYSIYAYGFKRDTTYHTKPENFNIEILEEFSNKKNYVSRILIYFKNIKNLQNKYKNDDVLYYYFGLDISMVGSLLSKKPYIYEESDLSHTYIRCSLTKWILERIDRYIIRHSYRTVLTSEGFYTYHFGNYYKNKPDNIFIIPNRLNINILNFKYDGRRTPTINNLRFAFVGGARFQSVFNFVKVFAKNFPEHEFHFYGNPMINADKYFELGRKFSNIHFHGPFKNPIELPKIYHSIDLVLSTYDAFYDNVRFLEPNKLYEALYFEVPIIVSKNTYLAEKVKRLNVGFEINALDDEEIILFIKTLSVQMLNEKSQACAKIDKNELINVNTEFFSKL